MIIHTPAFLGLLLFASDRQIIFAYHLARQICALGGQRLKEQQVFARPLEELTSREALPLIDRLKDVRAGKSPPIRFIAQVAGPFLFPRFSGSRAHDPRPI